MFITRNGHASHRDYYLIIINAQALDLFSIMCNTNETEMVILDCTVLIIVSLLLFPTIDFSGMWNVCMCMLIKRH